MFDWQQQSIVIRVVLKWCMVCVFLINKILWLTPLCYCNILVAATSSIPI